jgi:hypothetical protein
MSAVSVRFLLCDDVRPEASGKLTLVGLYPNSVVVVRRAVVPAGTNAVALLDSLTMMFVIEAEPGTCKALVRLQAPTDAVILDGTEVDVKISADGAGVLFAKASQLLLPAYGRYEIFLTLEGKTHPFSFDVRDGTGTTAAREEPPKKSAVKKARKRK